MAFIQQFQEKSRGGVASGYIESHLSSSQRGEPSHVMLKSLTKDCRSSYAVYVVNRERGSRQFSSVWFELTSGRDFLHQLKSTDLNCFIPGSGRVLKYSSASPSLHRHQPQPQSLWVNTCAWREPRVKQVVLVGRITASQPSAEPSLPLCGWAPAACHHQIAANNCDVCFDRGIAIKYLILTTGFILLSTWNMYVDGEWFETRVKLGW